MNSLFFTEYNEVLKNYSNLGLHIINKTYGNIIEVTIEEQIDN